VIREEKIMKPSGIALYLFIALAAALFFYHVPAKKPWPDWPINLIHCWPGIESSGASSASPGRT